MIEERVRRRLAAILAADVVGYGRLMGQDEAGTLAALKARRREMVSPLVTEHHGRIIKVMGDGVLIEFASAVDAVTCAVEIQKRFVEANQSLPEERRIVLRIGIDLGDVIVQGSDIYGDGVNIAARLEALAEPGGICLSGKMHNEVRSKSGYAFEDMGDVELKNIANPVRHHYRAVPRTRAFRHCPELLVFISRQGRRCPPHRA
jgi:adenylate cyclase